MRKAACNTPHWPRAAGLALLGCGLAAGAGAAVTVRPVADVEVSGAWVTAADLLPDAAARQPALAGLRLAALPACGSVKLAWADLGRALDRRWPGRYALPVGATRVQQRGHPPEAARLIAKLQAALDTACGGSGRCEPSTLVDAPTACVPAGNWTVRARVAHPAEEDGMAPARWSWQVDGVMQGAWDLTVRWAAQPAWRLRQPIEAGQAVLASELEPAWGFPTAHSAALSYDGHQGILRARVDLPAGALVPATSADWAAAARAGQTVVAGARIGRVSLARPVALATDVAPGAQAWARLEDGQLLRLRAPPPHAITTPLAPWEVLP